MLVYYRLGRDPPTNGQEGRKGFPVAVLAPSRRIGLDLVVRLVELASVITSSGSLYTSRARGLGSLYLGLWPRDEARNLAYWHLSLIAANDRSRLVGYDHGWVAASGLSPEMVCQQKIASSVPKVALQST